jgi:hypothetical protein
MMYFPMLEILKKAAIDFFVFYGTVICFHTKYNREYFINSTNKTPHFSAVDELVY